MFNILIKGVFSGSVFISGGYVFDEVFYVFWIVKICIYLFNFVEWIINFIVVGIEICENCDKLFL